MPQKPPATTLPGFKGSSSGGPSARETGQPQTGLTLRLPNWHARSADRSAVRPTYSSAAERVCHDTTVLAERGLEEISTRGFGCRLTAKPLFEDSRNLDGGCVRDGALPGDERVRVVLPHLVEEEAFERREDLRVIAHGVEIGIAVDPVRRAFKLRMGIVHRAPQADDDPMLQIPQDHFRCTFLPRRCQPVAAYRQAVL